MELDDEGGRTFLRVMFHVIMEFYTPLVSGSLQLMFKHFSQRAEVLQAFKQVKAQLVVHECAPDLFLCVSDFTVCSCGLLQVQLLVSEQDVENYKQIKTNLDQLRLAVEKSELWVEKSGGYGSEDIGDSQVKEQTMEVQHYTLQYTIVHYRTV